MYDIHPDLLLAFERARQEQLQKQTEIQMLLREAQIHTPHQRGRWSYAVGELLRNLRLRLRALVQRRPHQHPVTLEPTPDMHQEEEHDSVGATLSMSREFEKTTV
jgi:hypothetical protein